MACMHDFSWCLLAFICLSVAMTFGNAVTHDGANKDNPISCYQSFILSSGEAQLFNTVNEKSCGAQSTCMLVEAQVSVKLSSGIDAPGKIFFGDCISTFACDTFSCDQIINKNVTDSLPYDLNIVDCNATCCNDSFCNRKETIVETIALPGEFCGFNRTISTQEILRNDIGTILGNITSPMYPQKYPNQADCSWSISVPPGYVLIINVLEIGLEKCCDFLNVTTKAGNVQQISAAKTYLFREESNFFRFRSNAAIRNTGFLFQYTAVKGSSTAEVDVLASGGGSQEFCQNITLSVPEVGDAALLTSVGWPDHYSSNQHCNWRIIGHPESFIRIEILSFASELCCDGLLLLNEQGNVLHTLAGTVNQGTTFFSRENSLVLQFFSDENEEHSGFSLKYTAVDPSSKEEYERSQAVQLRTTPTTSSCGGEFSAVETIHYITSSRYPLPYHPLQQCTWNIAAPPGFFIELSAETVQVELCCDYLQLSEPSSPPSSIVSGTFYVSSGNKLQIDFTSDSSVQMRGFQLAYRAVNETTKKPDGCGYKDYSAEVGINKYLRSPNFPNHYNNSLNCSYTFRAPSENHRIQFQMIYFRTEACCDKLNFYYSNDVDLSTATPSLTLSGSDENNPIRYSSMSQMTLQFVTDSTITHRGFDMVYSTVEASEVPSTPAETQTPPTVSTVSSVDVCGAASNATDDPKELYSPHYPGHYSDNLLCIWDIYAPSEHGIVLTFGRSFTESCCDKVTIIESENGGTIPSTFSGNFTGATFMTRESYIQVQFRSDFSSTELGFIFSYQTISHDSIPTEPTTSRTGHTSKPTEFTRTEISESPTHPTCGFSADATNVSQPLNSPGWPDAYKSRLSCEWTLTARLGYQVQLTFISFQTEQCCDFIIIDDGEFVTPRINNRNVMILSPFFSKHSVLKIRFRSDVSIEDLGFQATFIEIDILPKPKNPNVGACGFNDTAKNRSLPLYSPNWPHHYASSLDCYWTISAPLGSQVLISFQKFNTESCCDYLKIFDDETEVADLRGQYHNPQSFQSRSQALILYFHSDFTFERPGFEATYELTGIHNATVPSITSEAPFKTSGFTTDATGSPIRCLTGVEISGAGGNNISQTLEECMPDSACISISATVVTNVLDSSNEAHLSTGQCFPKQACREFTCIEVTLLLPSSFRSNIHNCNIKCCYDDMCNILKNLDLATVPTNVQVSYNTTLIAVTEILSVLTTRSSIATNHTTAPAASISSSTSRPAVAVQPAPCGFNSKSSSLSQDLFSPGWPNPYGANLTCVWHITASKGKQVQIQFISLFTETCCDYLEVFDGSGILIETVRGSSPPENAIVSSHGSLKLRFRSDRSIQRSGFQLRYLDADIKGISPAPCGFDKEATYDPQPLYSPGFPQVYRNSLRCQWTITAPVGKRIHFNITYFDTEKCCDYLLIYENNREIADIRGRNLPSRSMTSTTNQLILRFISDSSIPFTGFQATFQIAGDKTDEPTTYTKEAPVQVHLTTFGHATVDPVASCGFTATASASNEDLYSPGWPGEYSRNLLCVWQLQAVEGKQVQIVITFIDVEECCDTLEVFDSSRRLGAVKSSPMQFISTTGRLLIRFTSDGSVQESGFQATFREIDTPTTLPEEDICGFTTTAKLERQQLRSPDWPNQYTNNLDCRWTIKAPHGNYIVLEFLSIDTEECCDRVIVEENGKEIVRLLGDTLPENPFKITSQSDSLAILFTSDDSTTGIGFSASYYLFSVETIKHQLTQENRTTFGPDVVPSAVSTGDYCGFTTIATDEYQQLTAPGYPQNYGPDLDCWWHIAAPDNSTYLQIYLDFIDTQACCDHLTIRDGGVIVTKLSGSNLNEREYLSWTNSLEITFVSDSDVFGTGFVLFYKLSEKRGSMITTTIPSSTTSKVPALCGFNVTLAKDDSVTFTSPAWPAAYWNDAKCIWSFSSHNGVLMQINFTVFDTEECCDSLKIREPGLKERDLRGVLPKHSIFQTSTEDVVFVFISDGSVARAGFQGIVKAVDQRLNTFSERTPITIPEKFTPETTNELECSNTFRATTNWAYLESENWPYQYPLNYECEWTIESEDEDTMIRFKFAEVDLCCQDVLKIYDGDELLGEPITPKTLENILDIPRFYVSTSNRVKLHLKTSGPRAATGFRLDYKLDIIPVLPCNSVAYLTDPAVVQTPNFPSNYPDDTKCTWTLDVPFGMQVILNISDLRMETCCDYIQVEDGPDHRVMAKLQREGIQENLILRTSTNLMTITFYSDSSNTESGLNAVASSSFSIENDSGACGFTAVVTEREVAFHTPNYPNGYPSDQNCYWLLRSPFEKRQVELILHDFKSEECCDVLLIYDGMDTDSPLLDEIRDRHTQYSYQSTKSSLLLYFKSDHSVNFRGFNASFRLVAASVVVECNVGLKIIGNGINQDTRKVETCPQDLACSQVETSVSAFRNGAPSSVHITKGECVTPVRCEAVQCREVSELLLGSSFSAVKSCAKQCCTVDGLCSGSADDGERINEGEATQESSGIPFTPSAAENNGVKCKVGLEISGSGVDRDQRIDTTCGQNLACSTISTFLLANVGGVSASVDVTLGQCMPDEQCSALNCQQMRSHLPESFPGTITSCSKQCCSPEGWCSVSAESGDGEGLTAATTAISSGGNGIECNVGLKVASDDFNQDQRNLIKCTQDFACSQVSATAHATFSGVKKTAEILIGSCLSRDECESLRCDQVSRLLPKGFPGTIDYCSKECCYADGTCSATSGDDEENVAVSSQVSTTTESNGIGCNIGLKIVGSGLSRDDRVMSTCSPSLSCAEISISVVAVFGGVSSSVDLSLGQCLSAGDCKAFTCDQILAYLPGNFPGTMTACSKTCCNLNGDCLRHEGDYEQIQFVSTAEPQVPSVTLKSGVQCSVGVKLSGAGIKQDTQTLTVCDLGLVCSAVKTTVLANYEESTTSVDVFFGQCTAADACELFQCEQLDAYLPQSISGQITSCRKECCFQDRSCSGSAEAELSGVSIVGKLLPNISHGINENGLRCYVGAHVSSQLTIQNSQVETTCDVNSSCMNVQTSAYNSNTSITVKASIGLCIPSITCNQVTCDSIREYLPNWKHLDAVSCQAECCNTNLCNFPMLATKEESQSISGPSQGSNNSFGFEKPEVVQCVGKDVPLLPGCTLKEYYLQYSLCATLFYNDFPYNDVDICRENVRLSQSCFVGLTNRCLNGNKGSMLGDDLSKNPALMESIATTMQSTTSAFDPIYGLFCERRQGDIDTIAFGLSSILAPIKNIPGMCNIEKMENLTKPILAVTREFISASTSMDACKAYDEMKLIFFEIFNSCNFSLLPAFGQSSAEWLHNAIEIIPELFNMIDFPKCIALKRIEEVRPSEPTTLRTVNFSAPDSKGCWSYNMDIMFLLDGSGSIRRGEFPQVIDFMKQVAASLDMERNQVGVIQYSHYYRGRPWSRQKYMETEIVLGEFTDRRSFEQAADRIQHHGYTTYTAHAIEKAVSIDFTASARFLDNCTHKVIVVITDGKSTDGSSLPVAANLARKLGFTLFAVGIKGYRLEELQMIANEEAGSNDRVYTTTDFFDLLSLVPRLRSDLNHLLSSEHASTKESP